MRLALSLPAARSWALAVAIVALSASVTLWTGLARAQSLVADLSNHLIAITTGFTGTQVVLFGATDGPGDVAVVVQGPEGELRVREKTRTAGIWANTDSLLFHRVPSFYGVATSRPLEEMASPAVLARHEIGLDNIRLVLADYATPQKVADFRAALIRNKQRQGLYGTETGQVAFLGQRLFRTSIYFPANVPTGLYTVSVFLIRGGEVVSAQTTPLAVSKIGFSADLYDFAQRQSILYALTGLLLAAAAGWLASAVFRRA
jgi:uncharacterized protein (TIGR02186 family)